MVNHRALPMGRVRTDRAASVFVERMNSRCTEHRRPNPPLRRTRGEALPSFAGMVSARR